MSNILNLLSEETFIEKMDRQNELLEYLVYIQGGVNYIPKVQYSWQDIQRIVRLGLASKIFELGAQLSVNRNGEELVFDIVSFDTCVPADSARAHSMTLMLHNIVFDDFEFNTLTENGRPIDGSDCIYYGYSPIRQWLNSSDNAGNWYSSINGNTAPSYADIDGFMKGFDSDFLSVIGRTRIQTYNLSTSTMTTTDDYFYLPSCTELGVFSNDMSDEGVTFGYFTGGGDNTKRKKYNQLGIATDYWTRSRHGSSNGSYTRITSIDENGAYSKSYYYNSSSDYTLIKRGICPVCNII